MAAGFKRSNVLLVGASCVVLLVAPLSCGAADHQPTVSSLPDASAGTHPDAGDARYGSDGSEAGWTPDSAPPAPIPWKSAANAVHPTPGNSKTPVVAVDRSGEVHVVWHDFSTDPASLYHARAKDGAGWTATRLEFGGQKSILPEVVADESGIHLVFQVDEASGSSVYYSRTELGVFQMPQRVMAGGRPHVASLAGTLHVVAVHDSAFVWSVRGGDGAWSAPVSLPKGTLTLNTLDLAMCAGKAELVLGFAAKSAAGGYDIWTMPIGSSSAPLSPTRLRETRDLLSDDLDCAVDGDGRVRWVWSEQDALDPNQFGIVESSSDSPDLVWHTKQKGSVMHPSIIVDVSGRSRVAWSSSSERIEVSVGGAPLPSPVSAQGGYGPRWAKAQDGTLHLVYYGRDEATVQQVYHIAWSPDAQP